MLTAAALGSVLFTVGAGALVYSNTRELISASNWVRHTQDVLGSLQRASLLTERVEYRTRLYILTGDEDQLNRARTSATQLTTAAMHIHTLVADNAEQVTNAASLSGCATQLTQILVGLTAKSTVPEVEIQKCQQVIGLMTDREQTLLDERSQGSQRRSVASVATEFGFVALALLTLVVLFCFLIRDALLRKRLGRQTQLANENLERTVKALEDGAHESELLTSVRDELQLCMELAQVYRSAASGFSRLLPGSSGCLCMINNSRQIVETVASWGTTAVEDFSPPESCCGLRSGQPRWRLPGVSEIHCTHFAGGAPTRYLCHPIVAHGDALGILYVQCTDDAAVQAVNLHIDGLRQLVQITGMAIATLNLQIKLENQSIRDSLTGLFNRHFMQQSLVRELARAIRRKQVLAVFMLDIDHFKRFNDSFGHAAGDTALQNIAEIFQNSVRAEDIVCRYGGEEFTMILPDSTVEGACDRAESIRARVDALSISFGNAIYNEFSVSIGIAFFPNDADTAEQLLRKADLALYQAKRRGRNQVVLCEGTAVEN